VIAFALIASFLLRLVLASQRTAPITGSAGMIGERGQALTPVSPGHVGRVSAHGEIWHATSPEAVPEGAPVRVTKVDGLLLVVEQEVRNDDGATAPAGVRAHRGPVRD
jgi:membrane-bound ClpP family serine protease